MCLPRSHALPPALQTAPQVQQKKEAERRAREEEELRDCTFQPRLNAGCLPAEGRAMRAAWGASAAAAGPDTPCSGGAGTPRAGSARLAASGGLDRDQLPAARKSVQPSPTQQSQQQLSSPMQQQQAGSAVSDLEAVADLEQFLALEHEVQQALQSVSLTAEQLNGGPMHTQTMQQQVRLLIWALSHQCFQVPLIGGEACGRYRLIPSIHSQLF